MRSLIQGKGCLQLIAALLHVPPLPEEGEEIVSAFTWGSVLCASLFRFLSSPRAWDTSWLQIWAITGAIIFSPGLLPNLEVMEVALSAMRCTLLEESSDAHEYLSLA